MCKGCFAFALVAIVCAAGPVYGEQPVPWLVGDWSEESRRDRGETKRLATTLRVQLADAVVRMIEDGEEGQDLRCRVDGGETRYRLTRRGAAADYALKCKVGKQSVEIQGHIVTSPENQPVVLEIQKKYQLSKDGSMEVRTRVWSRIAGVGEVDLLDDKTRFRRSP